MLFAEIMTNSAGDNYNFIGDYSSTATSAIYKPELGITTLIYSMNILIETTSKPTASNYGDLTALTNGISFEINSDEHALSLTNGSPIKANGEFAIFTSNITELYFGGSGNTFLNIYHNFEQNGSPLVLHGEHNDSFEITFNDNFTGLAKQTVYISGASDSNNKKDNSTINNKWI
jgi:hypothetical protein